MGPQRRPLLLLVECIPLIRASDMSPFPLQVYMVPHSHDDVGWVDTIDVM